MLFHIYCLDKPDHLQIRKDNREAHLNYLEPLGDRLFAAGPLLDENEGMIGSVLIIDFGSQAEAETFCANDPYACAGLFDSVTITGWKKALPK